MERCDHTWRWPSSQQSWATPYSSTAPSIDARCARCRACRACASRCARPTSNSTFTTRSPIGRRRSTPRSAAAWPTTPPGRSGTRRGRRAAARRWPPSKTAAPSPGAQSSRMPIPRGAWPNAVQAESNAKAARAEKDPLQWEGVLSDSRQLGGRVAARVGHTPRLRRPQAERRPAGGAVLRLHGGRDHLCRHLV